MSSSNHVDTTGVNPSAPYGNASPRADGAQTTRVELASNGSSNRPSSDAPNSQRSPLIPSTVFRQKDDFAVNNKSTIVPSAEMPSEVLEKDAAEDAILIYPKKIDDLKRFRKLFVGLLLFIASSAQGLHSLFGVIQLQQVYLYTVEEMVWVYLCGSAFGMFVFPFGALYDWFGPRPVVCLGTIIAALGALLYALMLGGHIDHTVSNACIFYAILSWGCYALDVAVLPAVLTHMPRDRGQPTGLLKTFSSLGTSFISCLFRGFFKNRLDHLMWFVFTLIMVIGIVGTIFLDNAPYVETRWARRHITPHKRLRNYLIRNRYMSQLVPRRRYYLISLVLILLNFYLTIQAVVVAYYQADMTPGKYRGVAIGSIFVTVSIVILIVPLRAIDGLSPQDEEVIAAAKAKEAELRARQAERHQKNAAAECVESEGEYNCNDQLTATEVQRTRLPNGSPAEGRASHHHDSDDSNEDDGADDVVPLQSAHHRYEPCEHPQQLIEVHMTDAHSATLTNPLDVAARLSRSNSIIATTQAPSSARASVHHQQSPVHLSMEDHTPHSQPQPRIEAITLCGEVFIPPVYGTTFFQSLNCFDIWLMFWTTLVVWGVGLSMTANWNIQIMVLARFGDMDYKMYILFAAMSGVSVSGGRVFLGIYEQILARLRASRGVVIVPTVGYPIASVGMFIAMIFWIALPGDKVLILAYILGSSFYGMSTSMTVYVLGSMFDRDMGMHYGFCFLGAAIGMVLFFYLSWFRTYDSYAVPLPGLGRRCIGQRKCMNKAVGIYIAVTFFSIVTSYLVHFRYKRLVEGKLKYRRVIIPTINRIISSTKE